MKVMGLAGAVAIALTFGTTMALAQTNSQGDNGSNTVVTTNPNAYHSGGAQGLPAGTTLPPAYHSGGAAGLPAGTTLPPAYGTDQSAKPSK